MSYIYAVEMRIPDYPFNPIKIGFSKSPEFRFTQFTNGPFPMVFLGKWTARNGQGDESMIHSLFWRYRLIGEWFYPAEELKEFIGKRIKGEPRFITCAKKVKRFEENYSKLSTGENLRESFLYQALNNSAAV